MVVASTKPERLTGVLGLAGLGPVRLSSAVIPLSGRIFRLRMALIPGLGQVINFRLHWRGSSYNPPMDFEQCSMTDIETVSRETSLC